jgi:hypothetical protein
MRRPTGNNEAAGWPKDARTRTDRSIGLSQALGRCAMSNLRHSVQRVGRRHTVVDSTLTSGRRSGGVATVRFKTRSRVYDCSPNKAPVKRTGEGTIFSRLAPALLSDAISESAGSLQSKQSD